MFLILLHVLWKHLQLLSAHPVLLWMLRISEGHFLRNKEKVTYWVPFCSKLWYNLKAAEPPAERRWSPMTDFIIAFLVSVTANVVSYFVCMILIRKRWIHDEICCSLLCYSRRRYSCTLYLPMDRQQTINKPNKHGTLPPCVPFSTRRFQCRKSPAHYNHVIKAGDFLSC